MLAAVAVLAPAMALAQAPRFIGAITTISGNSLTVKTDAGDQKQVTVPDGASIKRLEPGQKLSDAAAIALGDLAVGDRVLVQLDPSASTPQASLIVAMKKADVAQKQQKDQEAWQRGVAGLVKSIDPASGAIVLTTGAGPTMKTVTVNTTKSTVLLRYAPDSVRFDDAKPGAIDAIKPGDQFRARGTKNADGSQIAADEAVSGTFRNVAGLITQVDPASSTITVKDLMTKKPVTIHIAPDVQMRRLPERMAQMLAMALKGNLPGGTIAAGGARNGSGGGQPAGGQARGQNGGAGGPGGQSGGSGGQSGGQGPGGQGRPGGGGPPDMQRMLSYAPAIKLADLNKGEAVMLVASEGTENVNAVTLLAGVEPLLEAPQVANLLSNWSMGGGGAEAAAGTQ
ncbi:MAG TPA: hypothetical protein VG267_06310 [Terracidiphilus sp.]|nr:hypothetical protein [Terracidiphilus sp.]